MCKKGMWERQGHGSTWGGGGGDRQQAHLSLDYTCNSRVCVQGGEGKGVTDTPEPSAADHLPHFPCHRTQAVALLSCVPPSQPPAPKSLATPAAAYASTLSAPLCILPYCPCNAKGESSFFDFPLKDFQTAAALPTLLLLLGCDSNAFIHAVVLLPRVWWVPQ